MPAESAGSVPATERDITPSWLLSTIGETYPGGRDTPLQMERIGEGYGLSSTLHRVAWQEFGGPGSVVVKLWSTEGPAGTREVDFYRAFGEKAGARIPACLYGAVDQTSRRGVLVLEDLGEVVQGDCLLRLELPRATALAREVAALHARWWNRLDPDALHWLPEAISSARPPEWIADRRALFLERFHRRLDSSTLSLLERAEALAERAEARLAGAATTLLHADLHLDNVVFEASTCRPVLLDWARVARGPAAIDLAELLFAIAEPGDLEEVLTAWLREAERLGLESIDGEALREEIGGGLIRKFLASTCGVARWEPASVREEAMIDTHIARASEAVALWRERDPELFEL